MNNTDYRSSRRGPNDAMRCREAAPRDAQSVFRILECKLEGPNFRINPGRPEVFHLLVCNALLGGS